MYKNIKYHAIIKYTNITLSTNNLKYKNIPKSNTNNFLLFKFSYFSKKSDNGCVSNIFIFLNISIIIKITRE